MKGDREIPKVDMSPEAIDLRALEAGDEPRRGPTDREGRGAGLPAASSIRSPLMAAEAAATFDSSGHFPGEEGDLEI
jgi:hypothetical protein